MTNRTEFNGISFQLPNGQSVYDGLQRFQHVDPSAMQEDGARTQAAMQFLLDRTNVQSTPAAQPAPVAREPAAQSAPPSAQPATAARPNCVDDRDTDPLNPDGCIIQ